MINFLNMFIRIDGREFTVNRSGRSSSLLLHKVADFIEMLSVVMGQSVV